MKKPRVIKTRNWGKMTESWFWWMIRSTLRQKSRRWKPLQDYKKSKQIPYVWSNKRRKWSYICEDCWGEFDSKEVEVNHIIPAWSLKCADDLPWFVERLFCENIDWRPSFNLLCKVCHRKETALQREALNSIK